MSGVFVAKRFQAKGNAKLVYKINEHEMKIKQAEQREQKYLTREFWKFWDSFPPEYRYEIAMSTIAGYFSSGRADSLKEAFNLYEEQVHRWRMESAANRAVELQRQQTAYLASIRATSAISAAANVANYLKN